MKTINLSILLLLNIFSTSITIPQSAKISSPFVSVNVGGFITTHEDFSKVYDSNLGFVFGGGAGLPLEKNWCLYGKVTYFSKTGVPVIYSYNYQNWHIVSTNERKEGTATFKQWIINGGFQYNEFLSEDFTLGINGGITFAIISEQERNSSGSVLSSTDGTSAFGFFIGLALERNFQDSPISAFIEAQYNYAIHDILSGNYGGVNLSLGLRYYFKDRKIS